MTKRVCAERGCGKPTSTARCPSHTRDRDRARGTRQQRGYDADYDAAGREYQRRMDEGERFLCWRCDHAVVGTTRGSDWVLGHDDLDRSIIRGPEHPSCNYATSGRTGISPDA